MFITLLELVGGNEFVFWGVSCVGGLTKFSNVIFLFFFFRIKNRCEQCLVVKFRFHIVDDFRRFECSETRLDNFSNYVV